MNLLIGSIDAYRTRQTMTSFIHSVSEIGLKTQSWKRN